MAAALAPARAGLVCPLKKGGNEVKAQAMAGAAAVALAAAGALPALAEPSLGEAQEAAMRTAAGFAADDAARVSRARAAHWAPALRAQAGLRDDERSRRGELRLAPLVENDLGKSRIWAIVAQWDLAQLVYSRDEGQLALAHVHLARVRQKAAEAAAKLYEERWRRRVFLRLRAASPPSERVDALLGLLRATAGLDALTGGLYREQLAQAEGDLARLDPQLASADDHALGPEAAPAPTARSPQMFAPVAEAPSAAVEPPPKVRLPGPSASDEPIVLDEEDR
jgi:hypothetical protein